MRSKLLKTIRLATLFILSGCALYPNISYYDPTTYKNLTDLKPQILFLYEDFKNDPLPSEKIGATKLKLAQAYEYESGKGPDNSTTTIQIKKVNDLFNKHLKLRISNGKWSSTTYENATENITEAFDIAIKTESIKNKFQ
jgi:hypothetical protein